MITGQLGNDYHPNEQPDARPWVAADPPKSILVIRLQAIGDVALTLSYVDALKKAYPACRIDFLSRKKIDLLARSIQLFNRVYALSANNNGKIIALSGLRLLPKLLMQNYEVVIDLQRNKVSRMIRKALRPKAWSELDRFGKTHAGLRYQNAINAIGLTTIWPTTVTHKNPELGKRLLTDHGWNGKDELFLINPGGHWKSRNWPLANYVKLAKIYKEKQNPNTVFVIIGDDRLSAKGQYLSEQIGPQNVIDLTGKTTLREAYATLFYMNIMLSEDSGLMHMAATTDMAIFALIGSTPSYSVHPVGPNRDYLDSSDLACGNCHQPECQFGDVRCLTRYSPEMVFEKIKSLRPDAQLNEMAR